MIHRTTALTFTEVVMASERHGYFTSKCGVETTVFVDAG